MGRGISEEDFLRSLKGLGQDLDTGEVPVTVGLIRSIITRAELRDASGGSTLTVRTLSFEMIQSLLALELRLNALEAKQGKPEE